MKTSLLVWSKWERESHLWHYEISRLLMGKQLTSVFDKLPVATNIRDVDSWEKCNFLFTDSWYTHSWTSLITTIHKKDLMMQILTSPKTGEAVGLAAVITSINHYHCHCHHHDHYQQALMFVVLFRMHYVMLNVWVPMHDKKQCT